eukprot:NODE_2651_length_898_cov_38.423488.p2 GENE.NODE_2651_length_898_cov_38.423488~~NODE_2651_length_898_cov_38.423488.p2  ORF type:complete len:281 (-),score=125.73 NODE_2651_length_898_cov_38.423488:55-843(-)
MAAAMLAAHAEEGESDADDDDGKGCGAAPVNEERTTDSHFQRFLDEEYYDERIGSGGEEDTEGPMPMENLEPVLEAYLKERAFTQARMRSVLDPLDREGDGEVRAVEETRNYMRMYAERDSEDETESGDSETEEPSKLWDCETVLTTLSNASNHPGKIERIKVGVKKKPKPVAIPEEGGEDSEEGDDDAAAAELPEAPTVRDRNETPEERKARKAAVKELQRQARVMKKDSKNLYKAEAAKLARLADRNGAGVPTGTKYTKL